MLTGDGKGIGDRCCEHFFRELSLTNPFALRSIFGEHCSRGLPPDTVN